MTVGTEWLIDAGNCEADLLRNLERLQEVFARIIRDLGLKTIGEAAWNQFDGEKGITGLVMLTESHLTCHTYPEHRTATFNLYCCRSRPEWNWEKNLAELLGAERVSVKTFERGENSNAGVPPAVKSASRALKEDGNAGVPPAVKSASRALKEDSNAGVPPAVKSASRARVEDSNAGVPPAVESASRARVEDSNAGVPPAVKSASRALKEDSNAGVPPAVESASRALKEDGNAGVPPAVKSASRALKEDGNAGVPPAVKSASRALKEDGNPGVPPAVKSASRALKEDSNASVPPAVKSASHALKEDGNTGVPPAVESASRALKEDGNAGVPPAVKSASRALKEDGNAGVPPAVESASRARVEGSNAGVPPAVESASRALVETGNRKFVSYGEVKIRERGRLPHWEKEEGIYFVTFRLEDSLPQNILNQIQAEREQACKVLEKLERELNFEEKKRIDWMFSDRVDEFLDEGIGSCELRKPEIAGIVADALKHFDNERYHLFAWCIMPNHVHVVFRVMQRNELDAILHSWKSFTAHKINRLLGKTGKFWQREYYDHLVRDQEEFDRIIRYVLDNPLKANLKNWQWVWAYGKYKEAANVM